MGLLRRPIVPAHCQQNAHIYYVLLQTSAVRDNLLAALRAGGIDAVFHYVPLHSSPAGRRYGIASGDLAVTDDVWSRLIRLPLWVGLTDDQVGTVVAAIRRELDLAEARS
jgi:dTDP-4-amino-4,6-dideoxygalactose transaminase